MPKPKPTPPPVPPCQSTRLLIDTRSNVIYDHPCVDGSTVEGIRVIRSYNVTLQSPTVKNCLGAGILDYGTSGLSIYDPFIQNCGKGVIPDSLGKDTTGSGIIIQGSGTSIYLGWITNCGSDATFEHGIYVSKLAIDAFIDRTVISGSSASGIRIAGEVLVDMADISGSPRGLSLSSLQPGQEAGIYNSYISGTSQAVQVELNHSLAGYGMDYNKYPVGSKFRLPNGTVVNLSGWKAATGLDQHSREV